MKLINYFLYVILLLSIVVRVYGLNISPPSLYWDEMDVGYQAYSILKTGRDYFGNIPFLTIHSFADFRAPLLIYATIPFVTLGGLSVWSVRIAPAIFGVLSVFLIYTLAVQLFKNRKIALTAAALIAFAPWSIHYSRIAFEATLMLSLFLAGVITFLKGLQKPHWFYFSAIFFSLTLFSYNTAKLFIPVFLLLLIIIFVEKKSISTHSVRSLIIFITIFLISIYSSFFLSGAQRFNEISIFSDPFVGEEVIRERSISGLAHSQSFDLGQQTRLADKLFINKPLLTLDPITQNYLKVFSTEFLFISGDPNPRHSPPKIGQFYTFEFVTILLGLGLLILGLKKKEKHFILLLAWVIIAPLPAVITKDGGTHATRLFLLFPALTLLSALGAVNLAKIFLGRLKLMILILAGVWIFSISAFSNYYFGTYRIESSRAFQYGFSQAIDKAQEHTNGRDYVIIDDREDSALMHFLFYTSYNPYTFQAKVNDLSSEIGDFKAKKIGNLLFLEPGSRDWVSVFNKNQIIGNYLLIVSSKQFNEEDIEKASSKLTKNQKLLGVIKSPSGTPAFYIIENLK